MTLHVSVIRGRLRHPRIGIVPFCPCWFSGKFVFDSLLAQFLRGAGALCTAESLWAFTMACWMGLSSGRAGFSPGCPRSDGLLKTKDWQCLLTHFCPGEVQNTGSLFGDRTWHFANRCDIYKVAKVVHGNWSDNHCNWFNTWALLATTMPPSLSRTSSSLSRTHMCTL